MHSVVTTTTWHYINSVRSQSVHPVTLEALEEADNPWTASPSGTHTVPASLQTGTHTATLPGIASPTALPAVPPPVGLADLIYNTPPSGTPRAA